MTEATKTIDLLAIAERCEKATGPDRELDAEIGKVANAQPVMICDTGNVLIYQSFTASLDAAMTLVPEPDWEWSLEICEGSLIYSALDRQMVSTVEMGDPMRGWRAEAATPALALCAASLRVLAAGDARG